MAELNIQLTADPKLLAILTRIAESLEAQEPVFVATEKVKKIAPAAEPETVEAPVPTEDELPFPETHNKEELRQRIVKLCASDPETKRTVRDLIAKYAEKISDIPDDKVSEIWDLLDKMGY